MHFYRKTAASEVSQGYSTNSYDQHFTELCVLLHFELMTRTAPRPSTDQAIKGLRAQEFMAAPILKMPPESHPPHERAAALQVVVQAMEDGPPHTLQRAVALVASNLPLVVAELRREPALPAGWHSCPRQGCSNRRVLGLVRPLIFRLAVAHAGVFRDMHEPVP